MGSKAISNTTLTLGLLNAQVKVVKLSDAAPKELSLSFGSPAGNGVKQAYVDLVTGEIHEQADLLKGIYDDPKNKIGFHPVSTDAVAAIDAACEIDGLTIDGFIPAADFPVNRVETTYFLSAEGGPLQAQSLAIVREALDAEAVVGIGKCTLSKRQRPFAIYTAGGAVVLALLTFPGQCNARETEAQESLDGVEANAEYVTLARQLVGNMIGAASIDNYADDSLPQREALILAAAKGETIEVPEVAAPAAPVFDLSAALLASIEQTQATKSPAKTAGKTKTAKAA